MQNPTRSAHPAELCPQRCTVWAAHAAAPKHTVPTVAPVIHTVPTPSTRGRQRPHLAQHPISSCHPPPSELEPRGRPDAAGAARTDPLHSPPSNTSQSCIPETERAWGGTRRSGWGMALVGVGAARCLHPRYPQQRGPDGTGADGRPGPGSGSQPRRPQPSAHYLSVRSGHERSRYRWRRGSAVAPGFARAAPAPLAASSTRPPPPPPPTPGTARPLAGSAVNRWWVGGARCDAGGRPGGAGKGNGHPGAAAPMSGGVPAWSRVPAPPAPLLPGRDPHSQRQKTSVSIAMALPLPADLPSPNSPPSPRRGLGSACSPEPWGHPKSLRGSYPRRRGQRNGLYADTNICSCVYTARLQGSITPGAGEPDPLGPPGPNAPSLRRVVPVCGAGSPPEATRSGGEQRGMGTAGNTAKDGAVPPPRGSRPLPVPHRRGMQRAAASPSGAGGAVPTAEPPYGVTPRNAPFSRARSPPLAAAAGMGAPRVTATPSGSLSLHPSTPQPPGTSWDKDRNVEKRRPGPSAPDPRGARRPSVLQRTEIRRAADAASRHAAG